MRFVAKDEGHNEEKQRTPFVKAAPAPMSHTTNPTERQKLAYVRELKEAGYQCASEQLRRGLPDVAFPDDCFLPPHVRAERGPP